MGKDQILAIAKGKKRIHTNTQMHKLNYRITSPQFLGSCKNRGKESGLRSLPHLSLTAVYTDALTWMSFYAGIVIECLSVSMEVQNAYTSIPLGEEDNCAKRPQWKTGPRCMSVLLILRAYVQAHSPWDISASLFACMRVCMLSHSLWSNEKRAAHVYITQFK